MVVTCCSDLCWRSLRVAASPVVPDIAHLSATAKCPNLALWEDTEGLQCVEDVLRVVRRLRVEGVCFRSLYLI